MIGVTPIIPVVGNLCFSKNNFLKIVVDLQLCLRINILFFRYIFSYIYILFRKYIIFFKFFSIIGYYKSLNIRVPIMLQRKQI